MIRYIKWFLLFLILLITIPIIFTIISNNSAKNEYEAAKKRCGRSNPIVIKARLVNLSGQTNGIEVRELGFGDSGEKYYCTLTEAVNDGYSRQELDREAPDNIKKLYP